MLKGGSTVGEPQKAELNGESPVALETQPAVMGCLKDALNRREFSYFHQVKKYWGIFQETGLL